MSEYYNVPHTFLLKRLPIDKPEEIWIRRIGHTNNRVKKGKDYIAQLNCVSSTGYPIYEITDEQGNPLQPKLSATGYWLIISIAKGENMSTNETANVKASTAELSIESVTLINGRNQEEFDELQLIELITQETDRAYHLKETGLLDSSKAVSRLYKQHLDNAAQLTKILDDRE